jgi:hypothetical protein
MCQMQYRYCWDFWLEKLSVSQQVISFWTSFKSQMYALVSHMCIYAPVVDCKLSDMATVYTPMKNCMNMWKDVCTLYDICDLKLVQNEITCWLTDNFSSQKSQQYPYCIWHILVTFVAWYYCTVSIRGGLVPCCFGLRNGKQFIKDTVC